MSFSAIVPVEAIERMRADAAVSHGPCVKHRCVSCHRIFDSLMHGTDCPHCSGSSICSCVKTHNGVDSDVSGDYCTDCATNGSGGRMSVRN